MKRSNWRWLFTIPSIFSFFAVVLIPMLSGLYYSFTDWNGIEDSAKFIGFDNYIKILTTDTGFLNSFVFTASFAVVTVILVNIIGFLLAFMVNQNFKGRNVFRSIFFMPNLIGGILLGFTWNFIFTSIFSALSKATGIEFLDGWLSNTKTGFWGLVIVVVWQMAGYMMIIYLAQLQSIPDSLIEASYIDGAKRKDQMFKIIIPLMWPAFTIGLFLTLSNSFKLFDQNLALTNGGPNNSTEMLALNIYKTAFNVNHLGEAQAKAMIFLVVVTLITVSQLYITKKKEVEM